MLHKNGISINPVDLTISHKGSTVGFVRKNGRCIKFDIACRLIFGTPATHVQLVDAIYENDPSGGPEWAQKGIEVHLIFLRPKLKHIGLNIYTEKCSGNGPHDGSYVRKWIGP